MSDESQGEGWWQAPDGQWHPPPRMPSTASPPPDPYTPKSKPYWRRPWAVLVVGLGVGTLTYFAVGQIIDLFTDEPDQMVPLAEAEQRWESIIDSGEAPAFLPVDFPEAFHDPDQHCAEVSSEGWEGVLTAFGAGPNSGLFSEEEWVGFLLTVFVVVCPTTTFEQTAETASVALNGSVSPADLENFVEIMRAAADG